VNIETGLLPSRHMSGKLLIWFQVRMWQPMVMVGQLVVRSVVCVSDEIDGAPMDQWEMTSEGTPYCKAMTRDYVADQTAPR